MRRFEGFPREIIALRVSREIEEGSYVNLGIGIPTLISNWMEGRDIILHSEVGMIKTGPLAEEEESDQDLINASCQLITEIPGSAFFDISESFAMIRGGYIDVTVVGAMQVSEKGDFASWNNPSRGLENVGNIGGSMDLAMGAKKLYLAMEHTTPEGNFKILKTLTYPATGMAAVHKIFTDLAVINVEPEGLVMKEYHPEFTPEEIQSVTEADLIIPHDLKEIEL